MKLIKFAVLGLSLSLMSACAGGGAYKAYQGEVAATEIATVSSEAPANSTVSITSVNGTPVATSTLLAKAGKVSITVTVSKASKSLSETFDIELAGGQTYSASAKIWDVEFMPGNMQTKPIAVLLLKDSSGKIIAGVEDKGLAKDLK